MREVRLLQARLMQGSVTSLAATERHVLDLLGQDPYSPTSHQAVIGILTAFTHQQADAVVSAWRNLLPLLITKYHDGYIAEDLDTPDLRMKKIFYPKWWCVMDMRNLTSHTVENLK